MPHYEPRTYTRFELRDVFPDTSIIYAKYTVNYGKRLGDKKVKIVNDDYQKLFEVKGIKEIELNYKSDMITDGAEEIIISMGLARTIHNKNYSVYYSYITSDSYAELDNRGTLTIYNFRR